MRDRCGPQDLAVDLLCPGNQRNIGEMLSVCWRFAKPT
jgi:hypothetical protein